MELNITLVIQAINFLCTYAIMHCIVLKNAASSIQTERKYIASLRSAIADRKIILDQKLFEKEEHWKACQYKLVKDEPSSSKLNNIMVMQTESTLAKDITSHDIPQKIIASTIKESVAYITKIGDLA